MDGGSLRASNIKLAAWTDYFVVSEHFARDYMRLSLAEHRSRN